MKEGLPLSPLPHESPPSMKTLRRLLPALLLVALVSPAVHAQTTLTCATGQVCSDTNGNQVLGNNTLSVPSLPPATYQNLATNNGLIGADNILTDANTNAPGTTSPQVLYNSYLFGSSNNFSLTIGNNNILGSQNTGTGTGGGWNIVGYNNNITNGANNINILGSGFTVNGAPTPNLNYGATLIGGGSSLNNSDGVYIGDNNTVTTTTAAGAYGTSNTLTHADQSQTVGNNNDVTAGSAVTIGNTNKNGGAYNITIGNNNTALNSSGFTLGSNNNLGGANNAILGQGNTTTGLNQMILGNSNALGPDAVNTTLIGYGCSTDRGNTLYVCGSTLSGLSPGVQINDAATMGQLNTGLGYLGGGASFNFTTGQFVAPTYVLSMGTFHDVGSALLGLDNKPTGAGTPGPAGPAGPQGPAGPAGKDGTGTGSNVVAGKNIQVTTDANGNQVVATTDKPSFSTVTTTDGSSTTVTSGNGVTITPASGNAVTLSGQGLSNGGNTITNVGAGAVNATSTDAVNGSQLYNVQQVAKNYTDSQVAAGVATSENWAKAYTDHAVAGLRDQINRTGASAAAISSINYRPYQNSFGVGLGWQGGHNGVAVGFRHVSNDGQMEWNVRAAISGSVRSVGVGMSWGW